MDRPTVYRSLEAQLHDAFWHGEGPPAELPLMRDVLRSHPGPALEVGCGSGRLLLPLLAEGFDLAGLDNSPEMLALLRDAAHREGLSPQVHLADLRQPLPGRFRAILVPAFTLQLVDHPLPVLDSLLSHLHPGGVLYLTLFVPHAELEGDSPPGQWTRDREITLADGRAATVDTRYQIDPAVRRLHRQHHYQVWCRDGQVDQDHRCEEIIGWFEPHEIIAHLEERQCEILKAIPDFDPTSECPLAEATVFTIVARKSG